MTHNYLFDVTILATFRVDAPNEAAARRYVREAADSCAIAGIYYKAQDGSGEPSRVETEGSMEGEADLCEVDGEFPE